MVAVSSGFQQESCEKPGAAGKMSGVNQYLGNKSYIFGGFFLDIIDVFVYMPKIKTLLFSTVFPI